MALSRCKQMPWSDTKPKEIAKNEDITLLACNNVTMQRIFLAAALYHVLH